MKIELNNNQLEIIYDALKNYRWDCYKEDKSQHYIDTVDELRGYILTKLEEEV
jgi:hypothetical protein